MHSGGIQPGARQETGRVHRRTKWREVNDRAAYREVWVALRDPNHQLAPRELAGEQALLVVPWIPLGPHLMLLSAAGALGS